jgi:hypothetical protein
MPFEPWADSLAFLLLLVVAMFLGAALLWAVL